MKCNIPSVKKFFLFATLFLLLTIFSGSNIVFAQIPTETPVPTPTPDTSSQDKINELQSQISDLQKKIADAQSQAQTLSSQIAIMDNQINLTELRINATKQQIVGIVEDIKIATKKIVNLEGSLQNLTKILLNRIVVTYEVGTIQPFQVLLVSNTASDFFTRLNYLRIAQMHDKELLYQTQQAKMDYANQKTIFEDKKKKVETLKNQLTAYSAQLDQEKKNKQTLLDVTRNDEAKYQKLLQEAQAQIQAFKSFASSQGGASILPPQASPDGWYYNQRDERWGRNKIGSSDEEMWAVGCLVTATTMVMKKHGVNVTPADSAANTGYFFSNTAYMLLPWAGGKFSSVWGYDQSTVDGKLASGEPVLVGLRAGAYGMHFVVLKSGSNGDYVMNDPWNGPDLKFSDYYSTSQIFQYGYYNG